MWETGEGDTGTGCRRSLGALLYSWSCFPSPGGPRPARDCPTPSEGGPEGCTRLVTEEEAALASRLNPCLSPLLSRLGNWDGNWERDPSHPQRASPCGTPAQRGMFPKSYFRVLKSPCRAGAEHRGPLVLWDHRGEEEELQLVQRCSHSNVSPAKNQDISTNHAN